MFLKHLVTRHVLNYKSRVLPNNMISQRNFSSILSSQSCIQWKSREHRMPRTAQKNTGTALSVNSHEVVGIRSYQSSALNNFLQSVEQFYCILYSSTPVQYVMKSLVWFHDSTHLPWCATIIIATAVLRFTLTFPLAVYQQLMIARLSLVKKEMDQLVTQLKAETAHAIKLYKWDERYAAAMYNRSARNMYTRLIIRDNCHPAKTYILLFGQIPLWIAMSLSIRNFAALRPIGFPDGVLIQAQLSVGGFAWIPNLLQPDASLIFPILIFIFNLANTEFANLNRNMEHNTKLNKIFVYAGRAGSVIFGCVAAYVPSCIAIYWATSAACASIQHVLILSPKLRSFFHIPILHPSQKNPYKFILGNLQKALGRNK